MCRNKSYNNNFNYPYEKKYKLADFFDAHWDTYIKSPTRYIRKEEYKAVNDIRACRTEALGIETYACKECGEITEIFHSCKNRFCPTCSWKDTVDWAEKLKYKMFDLKHRHVVITIPHQLNYLIKINEKKILNIFMSTAADVFKDWMLKKYKLKPGIISVLHTFGEKKNFHVHVHMIVSWGGINIETKELKEIKGSFIKFKFLQKKFRIKFEEKLLELFTNKELKGDYKDKFQFLRFIKRMNKKNWVLHIEEPMDIPTQVIRYIGRYSKRACISEYKITNINNEYISFKYKDYKNKDIHGKAIVKEITLHYADFFPLLLQHVPYKGFRIVRYYAHYARASNIPKQYLFNPDKEQEYTDDDTQERKHNYVDDMRICSHCKIDKTYCYTIYKNSNKDLIKRQEDRLLQNSEFRERFIA